VKKIEKLKSSARQGEFILDKIRHAPNPIGAMDGNSGGCKSLEGVRNKDNCGAAGTKELNFCQPSAKHFFLI
jgi:hypothetical protein